MIDTIRQLLETHFYTVFILGITVLAFLTLGIMLRNIKTSFVPLYFLVLLLAGFIYAIYNRYKYDGLAELILGIYLVIALIYNLDRKSTRLNSSHVRISYAVFCLKKKKIIK